MQAGDFFLSHPLGNCRVSMTSGAAFPPATLLSVDRGTCYYGGFVKLIMDFSIVIILVT